MPFNNKYTLLDYSEAIKLHGLGFGSQRIAKILGYNTRSAIEDWINKGRKPYYFSEKRINACNSINNIKRMRKMNKITQPKAVKISAELRTKRLSESAKILSKELAYILGVVYGDGHVSVKQRKVILSATDKDFVLNFKDNLERWSGFKTRFFSRIQKPDNYIKNRKIQWRCYIDSIEASKFLKEFDLNEFVKANSEIKSSFLKGFFDSEGGAYTKRQVSAFNTNYNLVEFVRSLLFSLGIETKLYKYNFNSAISKKPCYRINIYRKQSILLYWRIIGFSIKRKQDKLVNIINSNPISIVKND